jgi:FixJ family two-component response regulator
MNEGYEPNRPLVLIVDDDEAVRTSIEELLFSVGVDTTGFGSARELLEAELPDRPGCLVLDIRMPGASGLDLQQYIASTDDPKPVIFLTGYGDIPMSVQAMKAGAVDFLTKPARAQSLLDAVTVGISRNVTERMDARSVRQQADRHARLTLRERQVLRHVAQGRLNKQIAHDLGISEATVKLHRSGAMKKMEVATVGELIRAWDNLPPELREG